MNAKKERQLNELREGYKNAQELIRFMDAKVGIVVGFSGMIFVHCMDKYYASFPYIPNSSVFSFFVLKIILLLCFISTTVIVFLKSFNCIKARSPKKQSCHPRILFPVGNYTDFSLFMRELRNSGNKHEYEELASQVFNVGHILEIKMKESRIAVQALTWQILFWAIIMLSFWIDANF